jgi:hypothetical protein
LDLWADGTLDADGRARLARAIERDPRVQAEAESLGKVNDRLKAFFGPVAGSTSTSVGAARTAGAATAARTAWWTRRGVIALAAACVVIGGVAVALMITGGEAGWRGKARELYQKLSDAGFTPEVACTTPEKFKEWTRDNVGEALTPQVGVPGLELVGWSTSRTFSPYTGVLIAKVDGRGVLVMLDRAAPGGDASGKVGPHLWAFPGKIGEVGVVEVTPFDTPRVIPTIKPAGS